MLFLGGTAVLLLCVAIGFGVYVYFFAPWDDELEGPSLATVQVEQTKIAATQTVRGVAAGSPTPSIQAAASPTRPPASPTAVAKPPISPTVSATLPVTTTPARTVSPTVPPTTTVRPTTTASPAATPGTPAFRSTLFPYSADPPSGWSARPGGVKIGDRTADAFVGPTRGGFTPSITVFAQPVAPGTDSDAFLKANSAALGAAGVQADLQSESAPPGVRVYRLTYPVVSGSLRYSVSQALFVQENTGWVFTLSALPADIEPLLPALRQLLSSFRFQRP